VAVAHGGHVEDMRTITSATAMGIVLAAIAWIVLYIVIGIPLWIAFVVAGGIVALGFATGGGAKAASH
jgi:phosphate/sulfate permease